MCNKKRLTCLRLARVIAMAALVCSSAVLSAQGAAAPKTKPKPASVPSAGQPVTSGSLAVKPSPPKEGEDATYRKLCDLLDLSMPGMEPVKMKADAGDLKGAVVEYRAILAARAAKLPKVTRYGYSLHEPANADELLAGILTTARYGDISVHYKVPIGKPGEINFFQRIPEYPDITRDISNMMWVNKLAEAYGKTLDAKYMLAWCETMNDFACHWPAQLSAARKHPEIGKIGGMGWIPSTLMTGMRLYSYQAGLTGILQGATTAKQLEQVDPRMLAGLLTLIATFEMKNGLPSLANPGRAVPNQVRILASETLNWGLLTPEMKAAKSWREAAIPVGYFTCSLDGSDHEQSLNYFNNGIGPLVNLLRKRLPASEQDPALLAKLDTISTYRDRVIPSLCLPDGYIPGTGTDPVWDHYGKSKKLAPPSTAFTSILLPYGGYAVQRDGWKPDSLYLFMKTTRPSHGHWRPMDGALQMSAYGRNLLVSPMGQVYDARDTAGGWTMYWHSAVSQNAIVVDGMSSAERKGDFDKLDNWRWHSSARYDFMETEITGPYKGGDFRTSGLACLEQKKSGEAQPQKPEVTDVSHRRQIHFLREAGCWVVTDRIHAAQPHDFTQSWCVGPEFAEKEVEINPTGKTIQTRQAAGPNLSLYQFGIADLKYERYFGVRDANRILGWVGVMPDKQKWMYTPAVNVHANWSAKGGDQVLITLLSPRPNAPERVSAVREKSGNGVSGFEASLPDGRQVAYCAAVGSATLEACGLKADAGSLLVIRDASGRLSGVVLDAKTFEGKAVEKPDFEFEINATGQPARITAITTPTGFQWAGKGNQLAPEYAGKAW